MHLELQLEDIIHWASSLVSTISVNVQHPINCHVQSVMKLSMKPGTYNVWLMLQRNDMGYASVLRATCECPAELVSITYIYILNSKNNSN